MRRFHIMLGLTVLVVALSLVVIFEPGKSAPAEQPRFTELKPQDQAQMRLHRTGVADIVLEKRDGHWWLTEPYALPADDARVNEALNVLTAKSERRFDVAGSDLREFGLAEPELSLKLGEFTIDFGSSHPINHQRHIRVGEHIHRIQDFHYYQLSADAAQWVSLKLLPHGRTLKAVDLPDRQIELGAEGEWGPAAGEGQTSARALAEAWTAAEAYRVEVVEAAVDASRPKLTLTLDDSTPLEFLIVEDATELKLARRAPDLIYTLYASQTPALLGRPEPPAEAEADTPVTAPTSTPAP